MSDEWGPWIEHDGRGLPVPVGTWVRVQGDYPPKPEYFFDGEGRAGQSGGMAWDWTNLGKRAPSGKVCGRVIRYRIRKPRGLTILQEVAREVEREDA